MSKYELKPRVVEAHKFTGTGSSFNQLRDIFGPHLTKAEEKSSDKEDLAYYVFDVAAKTWMLIKAGEWVVKDADQSITIWTDELFMSTFRPQPVQQSWFPHPPGTGIRTWTSGQFNG